MKKYRAPQLDHNALREACFNQPERSKTAITICLLRYQPIKTLKMATVPILWCQIDPVYLKKLVPQKM